MRYNLSTSVKFRKEAKLCKKRGLPMDILWKVVDILLEGGVLPPSCRPHPLSGKYKGCMECHLQPDWLLIWRQNDRELQLLLLETGTHTDLF